MDAFDWLWSIDQGYLLLLKLLNYMENSWLSDFLWLYLMLLSENYLFENLSIWNQQQYYLVITAVINHYF